MDRGTRAAAVLNNADLMAFIEEVRGDILTCISNTQPQETKTRESLYYRHYAIGEVLERLKATMEAGIEVVRKYEQPEDLSD